LQIAPRRRRELEDGLRQLAIRHIAGQRHREPVLLRTAVSVPGTITGRRGDADGEARAGEGVTSCPAACICAVMAINPATLPVCTPISVAPLVAPAGTVTRVERPPEEN